MKTWEMIKELTENPDKKFRRVGENRELYAGAYNNFVAWEGDYALETGGEPFEIYTDLEWEEIKKPVSFMEALNDGNRIRPESWRSECYLGIEDLLYEISDMDEEEIRQLLNGEWYVE